MNSRITISDLSALLAQAAGKDNESVEKFLREFVAVVDEGLFADRLVKINTIGTFKIIQVEKRESIDVNTKERIVIPEHYKLSFIPDKEMNKTVNKPFEAFETIQVEEGVDVSTLGTLPEVKEEEVDDDSESYEYEEVKEIAQEASGGDNSQVIVKDDVPPLPVVEEVPAPEERIITPTPTLEEETFEEETVLLLEEDETGRIPVFEPPMSSSPPPPPPPPPEDSPPFEEWEEPEEPESEPGEELLPDDLDELSNNEYREKETGDYYFTETEKYLETEEDMENYNGNRRKPGPVPYPGESGRGPMNNNVWAVILAAVIVVLVIVLAFLMLKPTRTNSELSAKKKTNDISNTELEFPQPHGQSEVIEDIGIGGFIDEEAPKTYTPDFRPVPEKSSSRKSSSGSSNAKAAPYVAQTSVTTRQGDRLNLIALNYYGDKVFWVYIYLANQSKLNNPDILPVGVTLTVPSSKDYDINRYSRLSLRKAYALQRDILNNAKASGSKPNGSSSPSNGGYDSYGGGQNGYGYDQYGGGDQNGFGDDQYGGDGQDGFGNDQYGGDQYDDGQGDGDQYGSDGQDDFGFGSDFSDDGGYGNGMNLKAKPNNGKATTTKPATTKPATTKPAATKPAATTPAKSKTTPPPANTKGNTKQQGKPQSSTSQKSASGRYL